MSAKTGWWIVVTRTQEPLEFCETLLEACDMMDEWEDRTGELCSHVFGSEDQFDAEEYLASRDKLDERIAEDRGALEKCSRGIPLVEHEVWTESDGKQWYTCAHERPPTSLVTLGEWGSWILLTGVEALCDCAGLQS